MGAKAKYKVLSPFLGASNKVVKFGQEIGENEIIRGQLESRLKGKYIEKIGSTEVDGTKSDPKKKKGMFDKFKKS